MPKAKFFYGIQPTKNENFYRVTKFTEDLEPQGSYDTPNSEVKGRGAWCSCPSSKMPCKHTIMVDKWLRIGAPQNVLYEPISGEFMDSLINTDLLG